MASKGAVTPARDYTRWIERFPDRARLEAANKQHGTASYLFGESAPLLLAWQTTRRADFADRLDDLVRGNLHNPAHEPLWGNAGTLLAAISMAEADPPAAERTRWQELVRDGVQALLDDMVPDPDAGHWLWRQDLYGRIRHHLGAGHGLAGNAFPALRAAGLVDWTRCRYAAAALLRHVVGHLRWRRRRRGPMAACRSPIDTLSPNASASPPRWPRASARWCRIATAPGRRLSPGHCPRRVG